MELKCNKSFAVLIGLSLSAALGLVLLFIGCALKYETPEKNLINWWGIFVFVFYILSPVPLGVARCCSIRELMSQESLNILSEIAYFMSACIVVSGFGLPIVMARTALIEYGAAALICGANIFVFSTVYTFFAFFARDEEWDWTSDNW